MSPPVLKLKEFPIALLCAHQQLCVAATSDTNLTLGKALSAQGSLSLAPSFLLGSKPFNLSHYVPFS